MRTRSRCERLEAAFFSTLGQLTLLVAAGVIGVKLAKWLA